MKIFLDRSFKIDDTMVMNLTEEEKKIHELMKLRAKMFLRGIKIVDIAKKIGFDPSYVSHVLANRKQKKEILSTIKEAISERRRNNHHV